MEASGIVCGSLGPPFCKVLDLIFGGLGFRAFILEGLGTCEGWVRHTWLHEREERVKTWQEVLISKALDVVFGTTNAKNAHKPGTKKILSTIGTTNGSHT